jgi:hypothetical protein
VLAEESYCLATEGSVWEETSDCLSGSGMLELFRFDVVMFGKKDGILDLEKCGCSN